MLWEELLHDPDSISTGSSESGEEEPHSHNHSLPLPNIALTSDEDEALPQVGNKFNVNFHTSLNGIVHPKMEMC